MNKKEDRRVQYTKLFLREALLALMAEKPIGKITPTELCRQANVNRNTFYAHYQTPSDLLEEIEEELYVGIMSYVNVFSVDSLDLTSMCKAIKEHSDLCSVIFSDHGDRDFLFRLLSSAHDATVSEWKRCAPQASKEELESFFSYCANGSVAVIRLWVNEGMTTPYTKVAKILECANRSVLMGLRDRSTEKPQEK